MVTCNSCGSDVTGKNFCPGCGSPVRPTGYGAPETRICPACRQQVAAASAFCSSCGHDMRAASSASISCGRCGKQNAATLRYCGGCGSQLVPGVAAQHTSDPYASQSPYAQSPYPGTYPPHTNYPGAPTGSGHAPYVPPQAPYGQPQYGAPYGGHQPGVPGQPAMVLRCPNCRAVATLGTAQCQSCHSSLIGVPPSPMHMGGHSEVHIHHHNASAPYNQHGHYNQYGHHGHHGHHHRRHHSGPLDDLGEGMGGALLAGGAGLVGGLVLGEVLEDVFDGD